MLNVYCNPTPAAAQTDLTNSINQIVWRMKDLLPAWDVSLVNNHTEADYLPVMRGSEMDTAPILRIYRGCTQPIIFRAMTGIGQRMNM